MFLLFCVSSVRAQSDISEDSLAQAPARKFNLHVAPSYTASQFANTWASFIGISGGITYQEKIEVSIYYGAIVDEYNSQIIYPTNFVFDQRNLGLNMQFFFTHKKIRPFIGAGLYHTTLSWNSEGDQKETFTDYSFIYNMFAGGNWELNKTFSLQGDLRYCVPGEVQLEGLEQEDFQGLSIQVAIKINIFSF